MYKDRFYFLISIFYPDIVFLLQATSSISYSTLGKLKKWDKFRFFNFPCKSLNNKNMSMVNVTIYGGWFASCFCYVCMDSIIEFSNFMFVSILARRVVWFTVGLTAHGWANYQLNLSIKLRFFKILNKLWGGM